jgi:hypothetical protein
MGVKFTAGIRIEIIDAFQTMNDFGNDLCHG